MELGARTVGVQAVGTVLKQQGEQESKFTSALQIILVHGGENMHNIEFAILAIFKCMYHWHKVHSHCCTAKMTVHLQNFLIFPN